MTVSWYYSEIETVIDSLLVLSRVQAFLPQLQNANAELSSIEKEKLDIENVEEDQDQYIEMVTFYKWRDESFSDWFHV
jgi:hypothetical protein